MKTWKNPLQTSCKTAAYVAAFIGVFVFAALKVEAAPANPRPLQLLQPDGAAIQLFVRGDEHVNWHEDMNGYTVMRDQEGQYVYAELDYYGALVPTSMVVGKIDPATTALTKGVKPQAVKPQEKGLATFKSFAPGPKSLVASGTVKNLVLLVRFNDHQAGVHDRDASEYDTFFNGGGTNAVIPTGSVKKYFQEVSYGNLDLESVKVEGITLSQNEAYYANGVSGVGSYPQSFVAAVEEALNYVNANHEFLGFSLADFDSDNDGFIDALTVVHSGYGAEVNGEGNWIWSHQGSMGELSGGVWTSSVTNANGEFIKVSQYNTIPALAGESGTEITRIAVACHELGHIFGLPDLYDRDDGVFGSAGIGAYCLMSDSWGFDNSGFYPPHPSAWCKLQLGWVTNTVITSGTYETASVATNPTIYRINQGYPSGEYLLIENRQPYGFDSLLPQGGLAIWHIDESKPDNDDQGHPGQGDWPQNGRHYKVALLQADGNFDLELDSFNKGDGADLYHAEGISVLSPVTVPNTHAYKNGTIITNGNSITGISVSSNVMNFTFHGNDGAPFIYLAPQSQSVFPGAGAFFTVGASGAPTLTYQWKKNGTNIAGATTSSYSIVNASVNDGGNYSVAVSNSVSFAVSPNATLTVGVSANFANSFVGTNGPNTGTNFGFSTTAGATNMSIVLAGNSTAYSHIMLKKGSVPTDSSYDFSSQLNGQTNSIHLEIPEFATTNWFLRVKTPLGSTAHAFTVIIETNRTDLRTVRPAMKPLQTTNSGTIAAGGWNYFRFEAPTNATDIKFTLTGAGTNLLPDLYIQRNQLPTTAGHLKRSINQTNDVIVLTSAEFSPGAYFLGVYSPGKISDYTLKVETINVVPLTWDPGVTHVGTQVFTATNQTAASAEFYFKIRTQSPANGGWRTALNLLNTNDANVYLSRGTIPTLATSDYKSERTNNSDGMVLTANASSPQFNAGEDWYLMVRANAGSHFTLVSGQAYVANLGDLAEDGSSSTNVIIGAEGWRFFQTRIPSGPLAWRLWLTNATNTIIYLKTNAVPLNVGGGNQWNQTNQTLVVPPFLTANQLYFIGIPGVPGTSISLDSRQHVVTTIPYSVGTNAFSTNINLSGYKYLTFRVDVPANEIAWQMNLTPTPISGQNNPNLSVRRGSVPNENYNDAFSEVPNAADSIALVPTNLANGTFYLTIYSANTNDVAFNLLTGPAKVTDINYVDTVVNDDINRVGWRFYRVTDIPAQIASLGWDISLTNHAPGTRLALRRNRAPSIWTFRSPSAGTVNNYDFLSSTNYLQAPDLPADVWYIGVYNPTNALGSFILTTKELEAIPLDLKDCQSISFTNVPNGKWTFFSVNLDPTLALADGGCGGGGTNAPLGWDLRLVNVTSGWPRLIVRREALPTGLNTTLGGPANALTWPSGAQWAPGTDWTKRQFAPDGTNDQNGRILAMGLGRPYQPGIYYIGITNAVNNTNKMSFTLQSRFIGYNRPLPITDLAFAGGSASGTVGPREAAYFHVQIPSNKKSWKVRLNVTNGEAMLVVSTNGVPNIESEKRMQKLGREHYLLLPASGQVVEPAYLPPRDCYLAVVGEGFGAVQNRIGTNDVSFTLESIGEMTETDMGYLTNELLQASQALEGGETAAYHFTTDGTAATTNWGFEITLENPVPSGVPWAVSRGDGFLADPRESYGHEGGENGGSVDSPNTIWVRDPFPTETIMVKARSQSGVYPDATYDLRVTRIIATNMAFESSYVMANQPSGSWRFFRIEVPGGPLKPQGWDIRLTNVISGTPQIVIARDVLPKFDFSTTSGLTSSTNWLSGSQWGAGLDWTGRSQSTNGTPEIGRTLTMGMGRPLEPGTYYVGVNGSGAMSYTLLSRGIGTNWTIPVQDLAFDGGSVTNTLVARETAYYHVVIPSNTPSWHMKLTADFITSSEVSLVVAREALPNIASANNLVVTNLQSAGKKMQKTGDEYFTLFPMLGQTNLIAGDYYVAVVSEGRNATNNSKIGNGSSTYILSSLGSTTFTNLGTVSGIELIQPGAVKGGNFAAYQFTVPPGTLSLEARLDNRVGDPVIVLRPGPLFPDPGANLASLGSDTYGNEGGEIIGSEANRHYINFANPTAGTFYAVVKARLTNSTYPDASFTLRLRANNAYVLEADGGSVNMTNQPSLNWRYYRVDVPTNALGWDLRLTNVTAGLPRIVVRRDVLPATVANLGWGNPGNVSSWPSSNQWEAVTDWTKRQYSADGLIDENGRILAMGMGRPLEAGTYYIGVMNKTGTNSMSYTLMSRLIGPGMSIPVTDIPFAGGSATNFSLPPREAAYYRVTVPSNAPSWKMKVSGQVGEFMMVGLSNLVPNVEYIDPNRPIAQGKTMQKPGREHYVLLPPSPQTALRGGTFYFAVVSEGGNPTNNNRIGVGNAAFIIQSEGEIPVNYLGAVSSTDIVQPDTLEGGEVKAYQFEIQPGTLGVKVKLENRIGSPVMSIAPGSNLPDPGAASTGVSSEPYGNEGGYSVFSAHPIIITLPNPTPGIYSLVVKARGSGNPLAFSDASYQLRIAEVLTPDLNFGSGDNTNGLSNVATGVLEDNERAFFLVNVPETLDGNPVLGWKLQLTNSYGLASVRVRKDILPSDIPQTGTPFVSPAAYIVPPYLTNGLWYVEVKAQGPTAFTLTSSPIEPERPAWIMPAIGETNTAPGLTLPLFGDSGLDSDGNPLPGDQSTILDQGYQHYYAIYIPTNNHGLLRVSLDAISGNPDVYVRTNFLPTITHSTSGGGGQIINRSMVANTTEYANWVPLDGKLESRHQAGYWYITVRANGSSNARYRLRVSMGNIQDLSITDGSLSGQTMAAGDWRYYRIQMPTAIPQGWRVNFSQQAGDVWLYIRDTVPPGLGNNPTEYKDWGSDQKNGNTGYGNFDAPNTYNFATPPTRPGHTYYVGFRALSDANFTVNISTNGAPVAEPPLIAFYGGGITNAILPGFSHITYRIDVPADGTRLKLTNTHTASIKLYLEQGTIATSANADRTSSGANSSFNEFMSGAWPWRSNQFYYLTVSNTVGSSETYSINLDGRNAQTDDNDNDGLPDAWELLYFGNTGPNGNTDSDNDGVSNLNELLEGTNPASNTSFQPRLTITSTTNGIITRNPLGTNFAMNSIVTLTAVPSNGYAFVRWTGTNASGSDNPLELLMNGNKNVNALFRLIGDDFAIAVPLSGLAATANGTSVGCTKETGEPNHGGSTGGKSVWWKWTAPSSGSTTVDTAGSSFNTVLGVYTGPTVSNLTAIVSGTTSGTNKAKASFNAETGTTYYIAVDGVAGAFGSVNLSIGVSGWSQLQTPVALANGSFQFTVRGENNKTYLLDVSTNLVDWSLLNAVTTGPLGTAVFTDSAAPGSPQRYYRSRAP